MVQQPRQGFHRDRGAAASTLACCCVLSPFKDLSMAPNGLAEK